MLFQEAYILVHQCGFTYKDVFTMTHIERSKFIDMRKEEYERESEEMSKLKNK